MDLDETWQLGLTPEKTKPCTFSAKSRNGFRREREEMGRRAVVFCDVYCHFPPIDFRQTFHEHVSRCWLAIHACFMFQKSFH